MIWVIFILEFFVLFVTSGFLFKSLFALLHFVFHSQKIAIFLLSVFFFPGVFIHEMSHLLIAELLRVRTHGIEFMPELSGTSLKMGSVKVEKSDILRSLLIGIAPLVVGSAILSVSLLILGNIYTYSQIFSSVQSVLITILIGVLIFIITNTMFSSKTDVEGLAEVLVVVGIIIGAIYFIGSRPHEWLLPILLNIKILTVVQKIDWLMSVPVAINILVVFVSMPLLKKLRFV